MRVTYSISENVVSDFNRIVPARKRSLLIEDLMARVVKSEEAEILQSAEAIEADSSFREVEAFAQAHGIETASALFEHE